MKKGDRATLSMRKTLCVGGVLDEQEHSATVLHYDEKQECIYFFLQSGKLTDLSLDAIYECKIQTDKERLDCTGRIKERYFGEAGKTFKFEIENGFYKINIKCVDKQMA